MLLATRISVIPRARWCSLREVTCRRTGSCRDETGVLFVEISCGREVILTYSIAQDVG